MFWWCFLAARLASLLFRFDAAALLMEVFSFLGDLFFGYALCRHREFCGVVYAWLVVFGVRVGSFLCLAPSALFLLLGMCRICELLRLSRSSWQCWIFVSAVLDSRCPAS